MSKRNGADGDNIVRDEILYLPVGSIDPDPEQPRVDVDDELKESIEQHGVLQAIEVRPHPDVADRWMIVDGERRWRGVLAAKMLTIPATLTLAVEDVGDRLVRQIVRNEGKRLTPWEEAQAYKRIIDHRRADGAKDFGVVQLAQQLGLSKSTVSDRLALAEVPAPFVPLFKRGELTPAAAPILRKFADLPTSKLAAAVKEAREDYDWEDAVQEKRPVRLDIARDLITQAVTGQLYYLTDDLLKRYDGPTLKLDRGTYAVDVEQATKLQAEIVAEQEKRGKKPKAEEKDWEREGRERRAREAKALKAKREKRDGQFRALVPLLPTSLDGQWLLFVIRWLLREMQQDSQRLACKALGLEAKKSGKYGSPDFSGAILKYAEPLTTRERTQLLLQLILVHDTSVSPYDMGGPERFKAAAVLLDVALDELKAPEPEGELELAEAGV